MRSFWLYALIGLIGAIILFMAMFTPLPAHAADTQEARIIKLEKQVKLQNEAIKILWWTMNCRAGSCDPQPQNPGKELKKWLKQ